MASISSCQNWKSRKLQITTEQHKTDQQKSWKCKSTKLLTFLSLKMGNQQSGSGGEGGKKNDKGEKKKYEPPVPTRVGKKRKKTKGPDTASKLPMVTPHTKCKLRLLKQERIKDYLLMEEEFIRVCIF